jgi:hypothetical protein
MVHKTEEEEIQAGARKWAFLFTLVGLGLLAVAIWIFFAANESDIMACWRNLWSHQIKQ